MPTTFDIRMGHTLNYSEDENNKEKGHKNKIEMKIGLFLRIPASITRQ